MKKNAFTLVELLAVIVILAIILAIAVPSISGIIHRATANAFESDAKLVIKAIDYKLLENANYDIEAINESNIETELKVSDQNYEAVEITTKNNKPYIIIVGKNKWDDLVACGSYTSMIVGDGSACEGELPAPGDTTPPVITLLGVSPVTVSLGTVYNDAGATALDDTDGNITANITITSTVNANVAGTYSVTYNVSDEAGNEATPVVRTVNVEGTFLTSIISSSLINKNNSNYYVGANPDNWIEFGQVSSSDSTPLLWRIVRSDNEGIKLVYEGIKNGSNIPTENGRVLIEESLTTPWDVTYIGPNEPLDDATYGSNKWEKPVALKGKLQNWYNNLYVVNKSNYVKPIYWCIGAHDSDDNIDVIITKICVDQTDSGGSFLGKTIEETAVGLLSTSDYISTSASVSCTGRSQTVCGTAGNYLYKPEYAYWFMNALSSSTKYTWQTFTDGQINTLIYWTPPALGIRPVVNLKNTVLYNSGDGSIANPYTLE